MPRELKTSSARLRVEAPLPQTATHRHTRYTSSSRRIASAWHGREIRQGRPPRDATQGSEKRSAHLRSFLIRSHDVLRVEGPAVFPVLNEAMPDRRILLLLQDTVGPQRLCLERTRSARARRSQHNATQRNTTLTEVGWHILTPRGSALNSPGESASIWWSLYSPMYLYLPGEMPTKTSCAPESVHVSTIAEKNSPGVPCSAGAYGCCLRFGNKKSVPSRLHTTVPFPLQLSRLPSVWRSAVASRNSSATMPWSNDSTFRCPGC